MDAQRAIWTEQQADPSSGAYNLIFAARVRSGLDADRLELCLQRLVDRHPALRTTFQEEGGVPMQRIHSRQEVRLTCVDARLWSEDQLAQIVRLTSRQPVDIAETVLRTTIFRRADDDTVLLLVAHQIAVDWWGLGLLLRELRDLYAGERLPPPPVETPLDYAADLAARLEGPEGREMEAFWSACLAGARGSPRLPYDRPASAVPQRAGGSVAFELSAERTERVRSFAREAGTTPYVVLLTAYQVLLALYSGEEDILVGSPFSGRMRRHWQNVVGNFVNTVVMRARIGRDEGFHELVTRGHGSVTEAMRNREYPLARACEMLHSRGGAPLSTSCRVGFGWQGLPRMDALAGYLKLEGAPAPPTDFGGMALEPFPLPQQEGQVELMLEMGGEVASSLFGVLRYDGTRFEETTARRLVRHYELLLERLLDDPQLPVRRVSLLESGEREEAEAEWAASAREIPYPGGLHRLLEASAARAPGATALRQDEVRITYGELDRRSNRIARVLREVGVDPRCRVAVVMDRSPDTVPALFAVLKVGGAIVPVLEEDLQRGGTGRLTDARVGAILSRNCPENLAAAAEIPLRFDLGSLEETIARTSDQPLGRAAEPDAAALVLLPEEDGEAAAAVVMTHRSAVGALVSLAEQTGLTSDCRGLVHSPMKVGELLLELLLPLSVGAEVVMATEEEAGEAARLAALIEAEGITLMWGSADHWQRLLQSGWPGSDALLALTDAAAAPIPTMDALRRRVDRLWCLYRPVGMTGWAGGRQVDRLDRRGALLRPLADLRLYVLDAQLLPAPVGLPGDLYVAGRGIGRGSSSAGSGGGRRLRDPFDPQGGSWMLRTGDRARRRGNGIIELLERS